MSHEIELTDCGGAINCGILLRDKFQRCQLMAKVAQIYLRIRGWRIFAPGLASQHCPTGPSAPFGGACAPQIGATGGSAPRTPKFSFLLGYPGYIIKASVFFQSYHTNTRLD